MEEKGWRGRGRGDRMRGRGGQEGMSLRTQREESGREGEAKRRRGGEVEWRRVEKERRRRKGEEEEGRS